MISSRLKNLVRTRPVALILLIFLAFIALGMPDGLLGVGWPSIRAGFGQPLDVLGMLLFTTMVGYLTSSFLSGELTRRWGVGKVLIFSCLITGAGLIGYTLVPRWEMMVALGLLAGLGAGAIDSSLNAYVAANFGPGLMQWLHASYGVGVTTGPLIMTAMLARYSSWRPGYLVVGGVQLALALSFVLSLRLWNWKKADISEDAQAAPESSASLKVTLRQPRVWASMALFFFYVGSEVTLGTWVYSLLTEGRGVDPTLAGYFAGSYWFTFTVGRVLAGVLTRKIKLQKLVIICITAALAGTAVLGLNLGTWANLAAVALVGFAFAPIFPGLMSGTPARVGQSHSNNTIGMQAAAGSLGGTGLTSLVGVLAQTFSLEVVPLVLLFFLGCLLGLYLIFQRKGSVPTGQL
ncbi:MAG TPA: MFS transporter [Anaerolineaceae bacterium]|jgi:fucose permease|nr:MFS transporter [Anaerolineaceae bacterium]HOE34377.1 MFS transporter [Anaerolineaceae bacterium]HOT26368.1 MFS transporter [Anaerolineaceae bacterium]HQH57292.1 MFS transporter [Anaerolineaceae bacterium]HQK02941.1 MFS transporter [Anaerolineaceae bacterium]